MILLSMNAPGSPSSPLHTTYLSVTGCFATSAHFLPVGKPAPPRPLSPDFNISSNPIISEALSVNLICGLTASASGGLTITLDALAPTLLQMAHNLNISPEILHRVAALACGGLDTLPHNGAVITTLAICGLTHKQSYKDIFVTSVVIPIAVTAIIVAFVSIGIYL